VRVRWHGDVARIELAIEELLKAADEAARDRIVSAGKRHGFRYITLDLGGYRQGSHNEVLGSHNEVLGKPGENAPHFDGPVLEGKRLRVLNG
jgi:PP-loop superfamily ATP-utilizing enzyme